MDSIVELVKRNEQLLLENAEALNDEEVEQEDIDEYLKIQGATKEELSAFENQFQIRLPEDFKTVYSYKNGSGYMSLIWPQEGFYRGYRLLSLKEIIKLKSLFQNLIISFTSSPVPIPFISYSMVKLFPLLFWAELLFEHQILERF